MMEENIAAIATAPGKGGVAIIRISGKSPLAIAEKMFKPVGKKLVSEFEPYRMYPGEIDAGGFSDYGLCVFRANNDVVDHQVVNMEFEGGKTVSLTMNAFNEGGRYIRIFGTKGELYANMSDTKISLYTFEDKKKRKVRVKGNLSTDGHGGGDQGGCSL